MEFKRWPLDGRRGGESGWRGGVAVLMRVAVCRVLQVTPFHCIDDYELKKIVGSCKALARYRGRRGRGGRLLGREACKSTTTYVLLLSMHTCH